MEWSSVLELALWGLGIWALLHIIRFFLVFQGVLKTEIRRVQPVTIDPAEIPPDLRQPLEVGAQRLEALGFHRLGAMTSERAEVGKEPQTANYGLAFLHEATGATALLGLADELEPSDPFTVQFATRTDDGRCVLTGNAMAHLVIAPHPTAILQDPLALDLSAQWEAHQRRCTEEGLGPGRPLSLEELTEATGQLVWDSIDNALTLRRIRETQPGHYILPWGPALRFAAQIVRSGDALARYKSARHQHAERTQALLELPITVVAEAYRRQKKLLSRQTPRNFLGWMFAATGLLFLISFVSITGGWAGALLLLLVVLFHELGHFLAMRACGFADTTIFFLPFLGAATTGKKDDATASEEMIVLLAGPVPGLLLGLLLSAMPGPRHPLLELVITTLIALNVLNLLPIYPFDGGRIVHLLLFGRTVFSDVFFQLLGAGLLLLAAWGAGTGIMLVPAAFIVLALPTVVRTARIAQHVDRGERREEAVLSAIRQVLGENLAFGQQVNLARAVEKRLGGRPAGLFGTLAWGTVYGAIVTFGTLGAVTHLFRPATPPELAWPEDPSHPLREHRCSDPAPDLAPTEQELALLRLSCVGPKDVRQRLDDQIDAYLEAPRTLWVPPPWLPELATDDATLRNRRTFVEVIRRRQKLRNDELSAGNFLRMRYEAWRHTPEELEAKMIERSRDRLAELEQLAEEEGLEPEIARVMLLHFQPQPGRVDPPDRLWVPLGGPALPATTSTVALPAGVSRWAVKFGFSSEQEERLELLLAPQEPERARAELLAWLCRVGCSQVYWAPR